MQELTKKKTQCKTSQRQHLRHCLQESECSREKGRRMQIVESQRIIITAWLKCTLNKSACAELSPAPQAKRGPRGSSKVHSFGSGIFFFCQVQTCVNLIIYSCCISGGAALKSHVTVTVAVSWDPVLQLTRPLCHPAHFQITSPQVSPPQSVAALNGLCWLRRTAPAWIGSVWQCQVPHCAQLNGSRPAP